MRSARSALGVLAGVLLALGVVALAGSGFSLYGVQANSLGSSFNPSTGTTTRSVTTSTSGVPEAASGSSTTNTVAAGQNSSAGQNKQYSVGSGTSAGVPLSNLNSLARQPLNLAGFVLLPIFAAFLFGFVLYGASRMRSAREESSEVS